MFCRSWRYSDSDSESQKCHRVMRREDILLVVIIVSSYFYSTFTLIYDLGEDKEIGFLVCVFESIEYFY
jgi:hypothetical protein